MCMARANGVTGPSQAQGPRGQPGFADPGKVPVNRSTDRQFLAESFGLIESLRWPADIEASVGILRQS